MSSSQISRMSTAMSDLLAQRTCRGRRKSSAVECVASDEAGRGGAMKMKTKTIAAAALGFLAAGLASNLNAATAADDDLRALVARYWTAWQSGPDAAAPLYAKDADLVFYDLEPLKYVGWNQYKRGVVPNILEKFSSIAFT